VKTGNKSNRDEAVRALNYLTGLKTMELKPEDLMISRLPVLPPRMRPVMRMGKMDIINDANYLYHDLLEAKKNYGESKETFGDAGEDYLVMYNAAKAVTGLGDPVNPKHHEQGIKGILSHAIGVGASPKHGRFQRKVIGQSVDNVGRGTITPDPELDIDQISIPESMAWTQFKPFVIRRLVRNGFSARDAVTAVKERKPAALRELQAEMKERPVYWNRAPSLHRYNYVGAWARISKGNNIGLPQAVEPGAGADHDGDNVNVHLPVGTDAVRDVVDKMMPSKNLWHPASYDIHLKPDKDYLAGLYLATTLKAHMEPRRFATKADAYKAYMRGELGVADPVIISELEDH
jgi:DNA-directed RNA polymerase subunit beta'